VPTVRNQINPRLMTFQYLVRSAASNIHKGANGAVFTPNTPYHRGIHTNAIATVSHAMPRRTADSA
jgi:hypothetical protein